MPAETWSCDVCGTETDGVDSPAGWAALPAGWCLRLPDEGQMAVLVCSVACAQQYEQRRPRRSPFIECVGRLQADLLRVGALAPESLSAEVRAIAHAMYRGANKIESLIRAQQKAWRKKEVTEHGHAG